jgi:AcrR family transcriptional regulator
MARAGLTTARVVDAASELVDRDGVDQLTIARLAADLGVKPPSLYNHVDGLHRLVGEIGIKAVRSLSSTCRSAAMGRAGVDALGAVAGAYRAWARAHPGLYPLTQRPRLDDPAWAAASEDLLESVLAVLTGYGLEGTEAIHATRMIRSALHGFILLEIEGGFGLAVDVDDSFQRLVDIVDQGLRRSHGTRPGRV